MKLLLAALALVGAVALFNPVFATSDEELVLIVEADTNTSPNYKMAPPITPGSTIQISALGLPSNLTYQWQINGRLVSDYSGIGQVSNSLVMTDQPVHVAVTARSNNQLIGSAKTTITPEPIDLEFYLDHPTRGPIYNQALPSIVRTTGSALGIKSVVYGAGVNNPPVAWSVGGNDFSTSVLELPRLNTRGLTRVVANYQEGFFNQISKVIQIQFSN